MAVGYRLYLFKLCLSDNFIAVISHNFVCDFGNWGNYYIMNYINFNLANFNLAVRHRGFNFGHLKFVIANFAIVGQVYILEMDLENYVIIVIEKNRNFESILIN